MVKIKGKEILEELRSVLSGKTLDAIVPPLIFVLINSIYGLNSAVSVSIVFALILTVFRLLRKQTLIYALGGLLGIGAASCLAYLTNSATNYFIEAAIGSALLLLVALISLAYKKPMAAWMSHLTRGWPLEWFWRKDVKSAYQEVTWLWSILILIRLVIQIILIQNGDTTQNAWANVLLGWPVTILVLVFSYIYGIWRLHHLGGPGVEEYMEGKEPPWRGQVRGF